MELLQEVFAMPRKYSHIQEHEKEILELRDQGMTLRQIVSASRNRVLATPDSP